MTRATRHPPGESTRGHTRRRATGHPWPGSRRITANGAPRSAACRDARKWMPLRANRVRRAGAIPPARAECIVARCGPDFATSTEEPAPYGLVHAGVEHGDRGDIEARVHDHGQRERSRPRIDRGEHQAGEHGLLDASPTLIVQVGEPE